MDTKRRLDLFLRYNKLLGLHVTHTFSEDLKFSVAIKDVSGILQDYQSCLSFIPSFSFISHFSYKNRGVLCSIDKRILAISTNRCFGGVGLVEDAEKQHFTFSEQFIANEFANVIERFLGQYECPVKFNRMESHIDRSRLFFSDEHVYFVEMKCCIQSQPVGSMIFVYPLQFIKQEQEKWLKKLSV